ncbi:MAG TPA: diguanylate cyclase [Anaerolineales bacterium]|nr:diguanylate cyclase [Anaerolineales bacterium]
MNQFPALRRRVFLYIIVAVAFGSYVVIFARYHNQLGTGVASLATIPVIVAGWYFGVRGGLIITFLSIVTIILFQSLDGYPVTVLLSDPGNILRMIALTLVAVVTGRLSALTCERMEAIQKLQQYEEDRRVHTDFLELLNGITARALEADNLQSTLEILTEQIAKLFKADDGYFSFWDTDKEIPIPTVAYGTMRDVYPYMIFEPGEQTLATAVLQAERPIPVPDLDNTPHLTPKVAALFPSHAMLGIPLIAQERKLGALLLGYNQSRQFGIDDIMHAEITAEQGALLLSKSLLLDEERKRVKQLTALHDVALTSIEADNEDQLIERVTGIIGQNLFPDNFGILLLDEEVGILCAHPSYRFHTDDKIEVKEIAIGEGITGEVAKTGISQCIGNVRRKPQYVDIDDRTLSELCVPIKFKERILGVINAESTKRNAFTADDERLLTTLAGQLATAIEQLRKAQAEHKWLEQLAHANDLIYAIAQITTQIERAFTTDQIIQTLGNELQKLDLTCIMAIHDSNRSLFTVNYTSLPPDFLEIVEKGLGYPLLQYSFSEATLRQVFKAEYIAHPAAIPNPEEEILILFRDAEKPGVLRILGEIGVAPGMEPLRLPLTFEENLLGLLWVWGHGIRKSDLPILSIFAKQIGVSLERARLFQEVQSLALTDPLTGLHNRRSIFELGRVEFLRSHRQNRPFCCLMLDLDHFKQINDNYGHHVGDQILQEFAARCKRSVREVDLVGRYGGEELIIIMPETDLQAALPVAERLRTAICEQPVALDGQELFITVSIGVAQKDENTLQLETLIARADQAMYIAKHKGRNRVATSK